MICPKCGSEALETIQIDGDFAERCSSCAKVFNIREAVDPAELLRLIEAAGKDTPKRPASIYETMIALKPYLSGDQEPLKILAGVKL